MMGKIKRILNEVWCVLLAMLLGIAATAALLFAFLFLDHVVLPKDSVLPLDERLPIAWLLTWPEHLWHLLLPSSDSFNAMLLTHILIFSYIAYIAIWGRGRWLRLP
jgi:hypothetical protein